DRLHSNHSDRLPWQYSAAARASADKFLNLRENLVPYTYSLAQQAIATGVPVTRPTYLEYPDEPQAYATAGSEYFYGPDMLVAPVTTPGTTATTSVWFPPGSQWTDYFTGQTYAGGTTQNITAGLDTMPVFVRAGAVVPTRTSNVISNDKAPLTKVTLTVAAGASGSYVLYEDDGTTGPGHSAVTKIRYQEKGSRSTLTIAPTTGTFHGQVGKRQWAVSLMGTTPPSTVRVGGARLSPHAYHFDNTTRTLTLTLPPRSVRTPVTVTWD
ncbi:DUF5110 domain-containing protein, partial [Streptomyces sp. NPDC097610]|uniref:glycoside hydrolase family 31 protein n=1 Tax=Streptomyces sp. NPDC097610 TaxID=3157227 RepID=UPI00332F06D4